MGNKHAVYCFPSEFAGTRYADRHDYVFDVRGLTEDQIRTLVLNPLEACKDEKMLHFGFEMQVEAQTIRVLCMDHAAFQQMFAPRRWRVKTQPADTPLARVQKKWAAENPPTAVIG